MRKQILFLVLFLSIGLLGCSIVSSISRNMPDKMSYNIAEKCANCHNGLSDQTGADISYVTLWRGSMHANASIDPYFLATVSHEGTKFPGSREAIESTCSKCHLPLARRVAQETGQPITILGDGAANLASPLHVLYQEGVACVVCHQIRPDGLGTPASFSGNFQTAQTADGNALLFGPFDLSFPSRAMMENATGGIVQQSAHLAGSELCAACHTLYTSPLNQAGSPTDQKFPEQVPYLEWKQSAYNGKAACQSCHLPPVAGAAKISNKADQERSPVHPHTFTGSNVFMLNLLKSDLPGQGGQFTADIYNAAIQRTTAMLQNKTARLAVSAKLEPENLNLKVNVSNLTGHKLPTAYPSRRVWLHVKVMDSARNSLFESGNWQADGAITGNDNDTDPTRFEPHYTVIQSADQVQIYEAILKNLDGQVTTSIVEAAGYQKDNRLLPTGFDKNRPDPDTAVSADALADADFTGGQDTVLYQIPLRGGTMPLTVRVELVYQSIGYRWLSNLGAGKTAELDRLQKLTAGVPNIPVVLAAQEIQVTGQ